jgi:hypothetical protein
MPPSKAPAGAGLGDYLREAFLFRWNLLLLLGGGAAAVMTPLAPVLLPLVAAGELAYLASLISVPRFRAAIDAKKHAAGTQGPAAKPAAQASLVTTLSGLPRAARQRFEALHGRCVEMRGIAAGVRGAAGERPPRKSVRRASIGSCGCSSGCCSRPPRSTGSSRASTGRSSPGGRRS